MHSNDIHLLLAHLNVTVIIILFLLKLVLKFFFSIKGYIASVTCIRQYEYVQCFHVSIQIILYNGHNLHNNRGVFFYYPCLSNIKTMPDTHRCSIFVHYSMNPAANYMSLLSILWFLTHIFGHSVLE